MFTCMCTRTWCYATGCFLACARVNTGSSRISVTSSVQNQQVLCTSHFLTIQKDNKRTPSSRRLVLAPWNSSNDFRKFSTFLIFLAGACQHQAAHVYRAHPCKSQHPWISLGLHLGWIVVTNSRRSRRNWWVLPCVAKAKQNWILGQSAELPTSSNCRS